MLHCTVSVALAHTHTHTQWFQIILPRQLSTRQLTGNQLKLQITKYGTGNAAKQDPRKISCWSWENSFCQSTKNLDITSRQVSKRKKISLGRNFFENIFFQQSAFRYNENNTHFILRRASTVFDAFWYFDRTWLINEIRVLRGILFQKTYNAFEKQKKRGRSKGAATLFLVYLWSILLHVGFRMRMFGHFLFSL